MKPMTKAEYKALMAIALKVNDAGMVKRVEKAYKESNKAKA